MEIWKPKVDIPNTQYPSQFDWKYYLFQLPIPNDKFSYSVLSSKYPILQVNNSSDSNVMKFTRDQDIVGGMASSSAAG